MPVRVIILVKVPELQCLIDTEKPDVVIGTESWLTPEISSGEIFPSGYTAYRTDRQAKNAVAAFSLWFEIA